MDNLTALQKNMICGGITGMIFKSTLGVVPTVVGGLLGVAILGSMTKIVEEGNQRGYVAFEMKY